MLKIGVIGIGHMGGYHASICASLSSVELVGIADHNKENLAKIPSPSVIKTKDYHVWLKQVDAVIIATPTQMHHEIAKDCLLAGKHTLIEKPLTRTIEEAKELFKIAREKNLCLHVGHVERFNAAVQQLKKIIHEPYLIESHRIGPFSPRPAKDSVVLDLMIHDLDIILSLVDSPIKEMRALGAKIKTKLADMVTLQILFENGVMASLVSSRASHIKKRAMTVHQKNNFLKLDFTTQDIAIHSHSTDSFKIGKDQMRYKQQGTVQRLFVFKDNPLKLEIEHFVNSIVNRTDMLDAKQDIAALQTAFDIDKLLEQQK